MTKFYIKDFSHYDYPLYAYRSTDRKDLDFKLHTHDYTEVVYVVRGSGVNYVDKIAYPIIAGDVYIINEGGTHSFFTHSELVIYNLMFKFSIFTRNELEYLRELPAFEMFFKTKPEKRAAPLKNKILLSPPSTETVKHMLDRIHGEINDKQPCHRFVAKAYLILLIAELCRLFSAQKNVKSPSADNEYDSFSKAIEFINGNFSRKITIDEVASAANLSRNYICEFFRKKAGIQIIKYINNLRIEESRKFLEDTELNISEICYKCGFDDSSYFAETFRRLAGQTPSAYRKNTKGASGLSANSRRA